MNSQVHKNSSDQFCDSCTHGNLSFHPDISIQCAKGRPVHFVTPHRNAHRETRPWGWQFAKGPRCKKYRQFDVGVRPARDLNGEGHASSDRSESERGDCVISRASLARPGAISPGVLDPSTAGVRFEQCGVTSEPGILYPGPSRGVGPHYQKAGTRLPIGKIPRLTRNHDGHPSLRSTRIIVSESLQPPPYLTDL